MLPLREWPYKISLKTIYIHAEIGDLRYVEEVTTLMRSTNFISVKWYRLRALQVTILAIGCVVTLGISSGGCTVNPDSSEYCSAQPAESDSDSLEDYSAKCDEAIGISVPEFDCDSENATIIPTTNLVTKIIDGKKVQFCDRPNALNERCDENSTFQILDQNDEAIVVALCRKVTETQKGKYGDIAVIQYNKVNGATCFYQALKGIVYDSEPLDHVVEAPSDGTGVFGYPWKTPSEVAGIRCHGCHDNGPFIRSPYLAQLKEEPINRLPGTSESDTVWGPRGTWNSNLPYKFIGNDFQNWKVFKVWVSDTTGLGNTCSDCHRMGLGSAIDPSNGEMLFPKKGTARYFGPFATDESQKNKNIHSSESPIWMKPGQTFYNADVHAEALAVQDCANKIVAGGALPENCHFEQFGQGSTCAASTPSIQSPSLGNVSANLNQ